MPQNIRVRLTPAAAADEVQVLEAVLRVSGYRPDEVKGHRIRKRSIDARKGVVFQLDVDLYLLHEDLPMEGLEWTAESVHAAPAVAVIGMGPAGLFAALRLVELGFKPILFERGKDVRARRRDLAKITRDHEVNVNSNYCFGEGGAGTYSDGKLYTRSLKRGNVSQVLDLFVAFGADEAIRVDAHPHIGTNKLPSIIAEMRDALVKAGAEVHFETRVIDFKLSNQRVSEVVTEKGSVAVEAVILATGHSARDVFELFAERGWAIESKPFALGVRVEHPQALIDRIQYHCDDRGPYLPPASYSLVHQVNDRGVYSFCMCPGGIIAPCATSPGEVVTNGWSPSRRNNPFANSGMVVSVEHSDLERMGYKGPLAAMHFQRDIEQRCCDAAGGTQAAPAQRLVDFVNGVTSKDLPTCSYKPGLVSVNLHEVLPSFIADRLAGGFEAFGRKMRGFLTNEAVVVAPESRTSSPVRIPRDQDSLQHPDLPLLYPCGEGAGYAGGIVSAALDGLRVAEAVALAVNQPSPAADQPSSI
jgi:uncharacterized FAD-dependent dehydrogenase